jgi:uncharacterized protein YqeY
MRDKIDAATKEAMKAKDNDRLSTLRMIRSAIQVKDIENRGAGKEAASNDDILQILSKMVKQREESAAAFDSGSRPELAAKERAEIAIIRDFQPKQLSEAEIEQAAKDAIAATAAAGVKDMGKVIASLRGQYAGQMDFGKASGIVKKLLG